MNFTEQLLLNGMTARVKYLEKLLQQVLDISPGIDEYGYFIGDPEEWFELTDRIDGYLNHNHPIK